MTIRAMLSRVGGRLAGAARTVLVPLPPAALAVIAVAGALDTSARISSIREVSRYAGAVGMVPVMPGAIADALLSIWPWLAAAAIGAIASYVAMRRIGQGDALSGLVTWALLLVQLGALCLSGGALAVLYTDPSNPAGWSHAPGGAAIFLLCRWLEGAWLLAHEPVAPSPSDLPASSSVSDAELRTRVAELTAENAHLQTELAAARNRARDTRPTAISPTAWRAALRVSKHALNAPVHPDKTRTEMDQAVAIACEHVCKVLNAKINELERMA